MHAALREDEHPGRSIIQNKGSPLYMLGACVLQAPADIELVTLPFMIALHAGSQVLTLRQFGWGSELTGWGFEHMICSGLETSATQVHILSHNYNRTAHCLSNNDKTAHDTTMLLFVVALFRSHIFP